MAESDDLAEDIAKLARRQDDMEASLGEQRAMLRQIVDGRMAPVTRRLCRSEETTTTMQMLLDILAGTIVAAVAAAALLYYLVSNPWPLTVQIPPPHSTELLKEGPR